MQQDQLPQSLDSVEFVRDQLSQWRIRDPAAGLANLRGIVATVGSEAFPVLIRAAAEFLPRCSDPDMSLNNLERFFANPAASSQLPQLLENRARTLETLVQLFSTSQFFSDLLVNHPDYLDMLRVPLRSSPSRAELQDQAPGRGRRRPRTRRCCAPSAASGSGRCCASAPTTSSATGRWRRSRATSRASPTPPWRSPWQRPCACRQALRQPDHSGGRPAGAVSSSPSASSAARS